MTLDSLKSMRDSNVSTITTDNNPSLTEGIDFVEICQDLFLGNQESSQNSSFIQTRKITHIINSASKDCPSHLHPYVQYYNIPISDEINASITPYLSPSINFIKKAHEENGCVLVHCEKGLSRSTSIVIAYLISEKEMNYRSALNKILEIRPHAQPNPKFVKELVEFWSLKRIQQVSEISKTSLSLKERFPNDVLWLDWNIYRNIRDHEGIEEGYTNMGRWGTSGAGVLIISSEPDPKFLLFKRSNEVEQAGEWSIPGGARKVKENGELTEPLNTAMNELREEAGLPRGILCTTPITYENDGYSYYTYILELAYDKACYTPRLNWENSEWTWFTKEELLRLPSLHKGVKFVINHLIDGKLI